MATSPTKKYLTTRQEAFFPNLTRDNYHVTSCSTQDYNCIAHAARREQQWWWPNDPHPKKHWPSGADETETVEAFVQAYGTEGYALCQDADRKLESGFEKVAIFVDDDGFPTHAARQLPDGTWTSKLGESEDIQHQTLEAMEGGDGLRLGYGTVSTIVKRPVPPAPK